MARCLIVGCGCRGQQLARELAARGHVVRGTSRHPERTPEIEAAGAEAVQADPDRVATLVPALDHVSVAVILLGTASGDREQQEALHGSRLEMLMTRVLDTTIRGVVYEAAGTVPADLLERGAGQITRACEASRIPFALITAEPGAEEWLPAALAGVEAVLGAT